MTHLQRWLSKLDAFAATHSDPYAVYAIQSLYLNIWSSGGIPDPKFHPLCVPELRGLYAAASRGGYREMLAELNIRMERTWVAA